MNINLKIWRQKSEKDKGSFKTYMLQNIDPNISFLEMLDILNNKLIMEKLEPVAFDHDCREDSELTESTTRVPTMADDGEPRLLPCYPTG